MTPDDKDALAFTASVLLAGALILSALIYLIVLVFRP